MRRIKITLKKTVHGFLIGRIVNQKVSAQIADYLAPYGVTGTSLFVQDDISQEDMLDNFGVKPSERKDLDAGWRVTKLVDSDTVLAWVGYNAYDDLKLKF